MLGESMATILQISLFVTDFKDKSQEINEWVIYILVQITYKSTKSFWTTVS